jgi:hypothetical protein
MQYYVVTKCLIGDAPIEGRAITKDALNVPLSSLSIALWCLSDHSPLTLAAPLNLPV